MNNLSRLQKGIVFISFAGSVIGIGLILIISLGAKLSHYKHPLIDPGYHLGTGSINNY